MKIKPSSKPLKQTILAVPAAALMLGASHAGTVGINYTADFGLYAANGNGSNYGTGYGYFVYGYQTTGFNVTGTAFGVPASEWANIPLSSNLFSTNAPTSFTNSVGAMNIITTGWAVQGTGIGNTNFSYATYYSWFETAGVQPGNDEVTWAYLDDRAQYSATSPLPYLPWNVQVSGLHAAYPNGYTIQTIGYPWIFDASRIPSAPEVNISDGTTFTNKLAYTDLGARQGAWGQDISHAGLSSVSPVMTADVVNIFGDAPFNSTTPPSGDPRIHSTLCGFIIADAAVSQSLVLSIVGNTLVWSSGTLQSSPVLGPGAVWTTVPNAASPYQFLPSAAPSRFYRLTGSQ
ncbi:MAG TPA: hypothetical protein VGJ73_15360 [Verrucomicrobiae bacterium]